MGVYWNFYVILGYELDAEKYNDWRKNVDFEIYEKYLNGSSDVYGRIVEDTMSGNYAFFGEVLYSAHQHGENPIGIIQQPSNKERLKVRDEFLKLFHPDMATEETKGIPKIIALDHHS